MGLEEAAKFDTLHNGVITDPDATINPEVAKRFAAAFAEGERRLASMSQTDTS